MLLFDRGRQDVLVTAVTPGWVLGRFNIATRYQGLLGGIFFCHGNHKAQTDPFAGLGGGWEKGGVFFFVFLVQQTQLQKVSRLVGGEEGWGKSKQAHIIFQLFPRWHFIITTLGGKRFIAEAGGGRTALWMQPERDGSRSTCGSLSRWLGSRDQLNSWGRSVSPRQAIEMHLLPFISTVNTYKYSATLDGISQYFLFF